MARGSKSRTWLAILILGVCAEVHSIELVTDISPSRQMYANAKFNDVTSEKLGEAFRRIGQTPHFHVMPWARAYQLALNSPEYCVYSTARTPEREALFQWAGPIGRIDWVLYARAGQATQIASIEDVRSEVIGGVIQDVTSIWLADHGFRVDLGSTDKMNLDKLINKRFNYWATTKQRAFRMLQEEGLLDQIVPVLTFGHTGVYLACNVKISPDTVRRLNLALHKMDQDGTSAKIDAHYVR